MTPAAKRWSVALGIVALGAAAFLSLRARPHDRPVSPMAAEVEVPPAPYRDRQYPRPLAEAPAPVPATPAPSPLAPPPPVPATLEPATPVAVPVVADDRPPPAPEQTASAWIGGYRDAVCGCKTRNCVRELQGRFLNTLGSMSYDDARDQQRYREASSEAIRCYAALPEDS